MEGTTLYYLDPEGQAQEEEFAGLFPFQVNGSPALYHQLSQLPGRYELRFARRPGARGKATEVVTGVEFLGGVSLDGTEPAHPE